MTVRVIALFMALVLLLPGYCEEAGLEEKLLEEIYNCAVYINDFNEAQIIALEEVEFFYLQQDYGLMNYDRLPIGEASLDFVIREYENYRRKMNLLNVDEYVQLMFDGYDVEKILAIYEGMEEEYETKLEYMKELLTCIRGKMWFKPYYDYVYEMAGTLISDVLWNQRIQCLSLNYLLTQVSDQQAAEDVWLRIADECVLMCNQSMGGYDRDPQALLDLIEEEKNSRKRRFDEAVFAHSAYVQYAEFILNEFEKGDAAGKQYLLHFDEGNVWFPMGDWMRSEDAEYEYRIEMALDGVYRYDIWQWSYDEEWTWVTCQYPPTETWLTIPGAEKEQVLAYADEVSQYGYDVSRKIVSDGDGQDAVSMDIEIKKDGESVRILWSKEKTLVFFTPLSVSLVPFEYIRLSQAE